MRRRSRKPVALILALFGAIALLWWVWPAAESDPGLVRIVPAAPPPPVAPVPVPTPTAQPDEARRGLDPVDAPGALKEPSAAELIARTRDAPPQRLTPEEIAAGRKTLEQ